MYICFKHIGLSIYFIVFKQTLLGPELTSHNLFYDNTIDFLSTQVLNSAIPTFSIKTQEYKIASARLLL